MPPGHFLIKRNMANIAHAFVNYLKESKAELQKVAWPTKSEIVRYSILVVISVAVVAVFFGALDFGLSKGVEKLIEAIA